MKPALRLTVALLGAAAAPADQLVFVKAAPRDFSFGTILDISHNVGPYDTERGGNLFRLEPIAPGGAVTQLTFFNHAAVRNPEVSWDGSRILFSMKQCSIYGCYGEQRRWQIYEIQVDGSGLRQVFSHPSNNVEPFYFPDGRIGFSSDRDNRREEYEGFRALSLFVCNPDGSGVQRLTRSASGDFNPFLVGHEAANLGRLAFTRWERLGFVNRFSLWFADPDGARAHADYGSHLVDYLEYLEFQGGPADVRELEDGRYIANWSPEFSAFGSGALCILDRSLGDNSNPIFITQEQARYDQPSQSGRYKYPYPLDPDTLVVAYAPGAVYEDGSIPDFGIYRIDLSGPASRVLLTNDPAMWDLEPVVVEARTPPPQLPSTLDLGQTTGLLVSKNIFLRDDTRQPQPDSSQVFGVRVLRHARRSEPDGDFTADREYEPAEILGAAPVFADGSFAARVPADENYVFQSLNQKGQAWVSERFWETARPGETRTCEGCHSPHGFSSADVPLALGAPSDFSASARRVVTFKDDVRDLLAGRCATAGCHDAAAARANLNLTPDRTLRMSQSYSELMKERSEQSYPFQSFISYDVSSRKSYLISVLTGVVVGSEYDDPWAMGVQQQRIGSILDHSQMLTSAELRTLAEWLDSGGVYAYVPDQPFEAFIQFAPSFSAYTDTIRPILIARGCANAGCHGPQDFSSRFRITAYPEYDYVLTGERANFDQPALSELLRKPLAPAAGGMDHDGGTIFSSTADPDYQTLLAWISSAPELLNANSGGVVAGRGAGGGVLGSALRLMRSAQSASPSRSAGRGAPADLPPRLIHRLPGERPRRPGDPTKP
ncbi:MAG TPA: hypothetical protein VGB99_12860 [Acidobacteriota bacterium]